MFQWEEKVIEYWGDIMSLILGLLSVISIIWSVISLVNYPDYSGVLKEHPRIKKLLMLHIPARILATIIRKVAGFYAVKLSDDSIKRIFNAVFFVGIILLGVYGLFEWLKENNRWQMILGVILLPFIWIWEKATEIGFWGIVGWIGIIYLALSVFSLFERVKRIDEKVDEILTKLEKDDFDE